MVLFKKKGKQTANNYSTIEIGGKVRPVRFGLRAFQIISKEFVKSKENPTGTDFSEFAFDNIDLIAYAGLKQGAMKENQEVDFSREDVEDWLDSDFTLTTPILKLFIEAFVGSGSKKK